MTQKTLGNREYRKDLAYGKRHAIGTIITFVIPLVISFGFCYRYLFVGGPALWISIAAFVLSLVFGASFESYRLHNYYCPDCGQRIAEPTLEQVGVGTPRCYYCPTCNIEWDTGIRVPPSDTD
jgi:hypothetical protein